MMINKSSIGFSAVLLINTFISLSKTQPSLRGKLPSTEECAQVISNQISDGNVTRINEYPWMVLIEYKKDEYKGRRKYECVGSLINDRYVLTAAHCLIGIPNNFKVFRVRLGEWDTTTDPDCETNNDGSGKCADPSIDVSIEKAIPHENYVQRTYTNDIGLVRLSRSIQYTDFIRPICLTLKQSTFDGHTMEVSGWYTYKYAERSNVKLKTQVQVLPLSDCQRRYKANNINLDSSKICVVGEVGVDLCRGDTGGPLIGWDVNKSKRVYYFTAGVQSFGSGTCNITFPDAYTRVSDYVDWIQENIEL